MSDHPLTGFGFLSGASYPLKALRLLRQQPQFWSYIAIPLLLNIALGLFLYWQFLGLSQEGSEWLGIYLQRGWQTWASQLPDFLQGLGLILRALVALIQWTLYFFGLLATGFILAQVGVLLGSPWYGRLSEQLEILCLGQLTVQEIGLGRELWRALAFEFKKLVLILGIGGLSLGLNFAPGLGTLLASGLGISLTATLTCLDCFDPPLERRRLCFRHKLGLVARNLPASAGFGLVCLFLISIPLVNLVTLPLCVSAGTLFCCERIIPRLK
ncbi:EI24 domain-containing protein [Synechocystis sp. LKSZ1]|uniref:EI24 domain-containing protein n=1 Tax=Synechocystis sp. LKSZ1 TaxID=3144951 RepID=UPI00336BEDFE